jgi:predicted Zn-dependent peptidase
MSILDRSQPPLGGDIRSFDFPEVTRSPLASGLDLRVAKVTRLPVVSVNLFFRAGEAALGEDHAGLAVLTGDALEGGTARRSGTELAEAFESIGARFGCSTGWEGTNLSLSCLAERLPDGLALLAEALLEPAFPEEEVARAREQQIARIRQLAMDPSSVASDAAARHIYATGAPYARPMRGTVSSMESSTAARLKGYVEGYYRPVGGGLVLAGDVDFGEVEAMALEHLGAWSGEPPVTSDIPAEPSTRERRVRVIDRPGSVQSEIRVGHVGTSRSDPDLFPLIVLNTLFGGAFTSRLNLNLREKNGFTYGVRSRFAFRRRPGPFQVSTSVGTEVTAPAVREIMAELDLLVADGPHEDEVAAARDFAAGIFPLRLETVGQVAARVSELIVYGLPDDYHHRYRERIRSVTREDAVEAARRHIRPEEVQIVVVGDAESIAPALEELDLGPLEVEVSAAS